jgi:hypothetical protein
VPPGDVVIAAAHDPLGFSNPLPLASAVRPTELRLILRREQRICGTVLTSAGKPVPNATITAYPTDDQALVWGDFLASSDAVLAKSTETGAFCIEGLPPAKEYSVVWTPLPSRTSVTMLREHVLPNATGLVLEGDLEHEKAPFLRLRLVSRVTALPIRACSVTVYAKLAPSPYVDVLTRQFESEDGVLVLDPPLRGNQYLLLVMAPGLPVQLVGPIDADAGDQVGDVYLNGPASLEVALQDLPSTASDPEVSVRFTAGVGPTWSKRTDAGHSVRFDTLGPGSYTITSPVCAAPVQTALMTGETRRVTVSAKSR